MFSQLYIRRITMEAEPDRGSYLRDIPAISHLIKDKFIELSKNITFFSSVKMAQENRRSLKPLQ